MADSPISTALSALLSPNLPAPLKAIAGLTITALEDARHLPVKVSELPSTVLTTLATGSMRVQQQYADWVAKGEEFIGSLREPQAEAPAWATFDEDLPHAGLGPSQSQVDAGSSTPSRVSNGLGPGSAFDLQDADDLPVARRRAPAKKVGPAKKAAPAKKSAPAKKAGPAKKAAPIKKSAPATKATPAKKAAPVKKAAPATSATPLAQPDAPTPSAVPHSAVPATSSPAASADSTTGPAAMTAASSVEETTVGESAGKPTTPQSLPDFDSLTIPQLRSRLKTLKLAEVRELIDYEEAATNRPAVVQMLRARVETLQK